MEWPEFGVDRECCLAVAWKQQPPLGMSHCYMYMPQFPESQDAYRTIVDFFRKNLG